MGHNKVVILVTTGLLLLSGIFFYTIHEDAVEYRAGVSEDVIVEQTWELPDALKEVSGIAFLAPNKIACIQDEKGTIFIYDLESSSIEKEIEFAGSGDYEGIALDGSTAYVLAANGEIFRIQDFINEPVTEAFRTSFTSENDVESLFFDTDGDRLLLMPKEKGLQSTEAKGIYVVDIKAMEMADVPLLELTFKEEMFNDLKEDNPSRSFYPSEIARDPQTGNFIILEAKKPHLLMLDSNGDPHILHRLDPNLFPQPEGLTFDDAGNLYISNEGNPATIHRVKIKDK
ncbi:SdiA-regulated domain-containing protein [Salinimicrobium xinjiangense]|uniref:SdiA-regulated domain-containing protein n=1 Tax=Salinimicrobium xinjiangense TaxID=438596 RepID=UPI00146C55EF|nr:SdiA-regulated domain-containing protein [Salinimicrobium xinjiangense]